MRAGRSRIAIIALLASLGAATVAEAQSYGPARSGHVYAESRFGHGTVSGAVRNTPRGRQVQLPGGSWIYCRATCASTLREETVDFWEAHGPGGGAGARFGLLDYIWPR